MTNNLHQQKLELAKLKKLYSSQLVQCYSADDLDSEPTTEQQRFLEDIVDTKIRWAVCDNQSGKSSAGAREVAWIFANNHPFFERPKEWGNGSVSMMVVGKKTDQMELELWRKKIRPLLPPGEYKEVRSGNVLQRVENKMNGNILIFQSHNNVEEARENVQGHTLVYVLLDEMPKSHRLISELVVRIISKNGRLVGTFTPLVFNVKIRQLVDKAKEPISKKYHFSIYDNPALAHRIDEVIETIRQGCASESEFKCRVGGKWMPAGVRVSCYDPDEHKRQPTNYDALAWRHVAVVDPAASGKAGLTVWGEDPKTGSWYNVKAKYLQGDASYILVGEVEKEIEPYNICLRVCDPNPAGFYKEAARQKIWYRTVSDKANRKADLIDTANTALKKGKAFLTSASEVLEDELVACAWSETNPDRIVAGSSYHCFDTMQYGIDNFPSWDPEIIVKRTHEEQVKYDSFKQKEKKAKQKQQAVLQILSRNKRKKLNATRRGRRRAFSK